MDKQFQKELEQRLASIDAPYLNYDESEFWMIRSIYEYIDFYAKEHQLMNTALALPLSRGIHNGSHRKSTILRNGERYRQPYVIHCLVVCRNLVDLNLPLSNEELDVVLASALCHDMIEDIPFPKKGEELMELFGLDPRVYEIVKLLSKRKDFTEEEEKAHFHGIESNRLALLIKLSDRSHNVEDLYNMSHWKVHEYIGETEKYFLPMCDYGFLHYPELVAVLDVLRNKILSLTQVSEILVDRLALREKELLDEVVVLKKENEELRKELEAIWR